MFEILAGADDTRLIQVIYHVGLRMRERRLFDDRETRRERMLAAFGRDLDPTLIETVEAVITEIEGREGLHFTKIPDARMDGYYNDLSEMYWSRVRSRPDFDPERGQRLLEELRREYGMAA